MDDDQKNTDMEPADEIMLPGFRFHPTDEELVGFYLRRKVQHRPLSIELIKQLDIYKFDPWDLPKMASIGEKEWYFYCPRDRKYRNSARPNRVTGAGFWKATGTDRPIYSSDGIKCIGLKKSLVFYKGRAAKGIKTDWMMHEFRLPSLPDSTNASKKSMDKNNVPANDSWAICRIFKKNTIAQRALAQAWAPPLAGRRAVESISSPMNSEIISDNCMNVNFNVNQEDNMSNETRNQTSTSSNLSSHTGDQCCNNINYDYNQNLKPRNIDQMPCVQQATSYSYIASGLQGSSYNKIDGSCNLLSSFTSGRSMPLPNLEVPCTNYFGSSHILDPNLSHVKGTLDLVSCMFHMSPCNIADHPAVRSSSGLHDITAAFAAPKINQEDEDHADAIFRKTHSQLICPRSGSTPNLPLPSHPYDVVKTVSWDTDVSALELSATDAAN